jgi:hypothetical protein
VHKKLKVNLNLRKSEKIDLRTFSGVFSTGLPLNLTAKTDLISEYKHDSLF